MATATTNHLLLVGLKQGLKMTLRKLVIIIVVYSLARNVLGILNDDFEVDIEFGRVPEIIVHAGSDVTIPCHAQLKADVKWRYQRRRNETKRIIYSKGVIQRPFRRRFSLERLPDGYFSLKIRDAKRHDEGLYDCVVLEGFCGTIQEHVIKVAAEGKSTSPFRPIGNHGSSSSHRQRLPEEHKHEEEDESQLSGTLDTPSTDDIIMAPFIRTTTVVVFVAVGISMVVVVLVIAILMRCGPFERRCMFKAWKCKKNMLSRAELLCAGLQNRQNLEPDEKRHDVVCQTEVMLDKPLEVTSEYDNGNEKPLVALGTCSPHLTMGAADEEVDA